MNPFFIQKYLFRLFYVLAFALFVGIFVYAFKTEMEMESVGEQAPFTQTLRAENDTLPRNRSIGLSEPHRTPRELARWISERVSEVLTFDSQNFDRQMALSRGYFTDAGYKEFETYVQQANIRSTLTNNDQKMSVIVEEAPLLLNSGAVEERFKWLYEVPITVSYAPRQQREIRPDMNMPGRQLTVRLQIGRYDDDSVNEGVRIESWNVSARRR